MSKDGLVGFTIIVVGILVASAGILALAQRAVHEIWPWDDTTPEYPPDAPDSSESHEEGGTGT